MLRYHWFIAATIALLTGLTPGRFSVGEPFQLPKDDGYRGIWYANQPSRDEYAFKYSGGMATYPHQHYPIAIHAPAVGKTFFVYGGTDTNQKTLLHMVSYFDHARGVVPKPRILLDKKTTDAHDNPTLSMDDEGHLWIFSNAHGTSRPAYIHRSTMPYAIDTFELIQETNFSYSQPWHVPKEGFFFFHTRYRKGRILHWMTSPDGRIWSKPRVLAAVEAGHYQLSASAGGKIATAFNVHPADVGLNGRTNLYYLETANVGQTWTTVDGRDVQPPVTSSDHISLVHDYRSEGLLVYLKDMDFDENGHPVILFLTSKGYASGPANDPRVWRLARWTGATWKITDFTRSDHNYDHGSLYLEKSNLWRIIAPTDPGPQEYNPGGQVVVWTSSDKGESWKKERTITHDESFNHTFVRRPVDAHADFYAMWANGHAREKSASAIFFTNRAGSKVYRLPTQMHEEEQSPEPIMLPDAATAKP